ncbi:hypothetical protein LPB140_11360 [Sphingorhabdus lutea]|uniref:Class II Histidinyl-tRNA synthetase (HisRS)-like catalytic core domain-containing protein n=1 Tax=Sphingorhabdus lutea TaxID=1913578 RepID=A0A1L3JDS9_9SPHN|nr:ATP phosphoribosyltransferase regulatory subunit [Sphingorhabdus lutea]APG63282.1 hypothetical protein LPB140_11360 [Sphingorhabdus lutea]
MDKKDMILPSGFHDRLPPQAESAARLRRCLLDILAGYGYRRVEPTLVENEAGLRANMSRDAAQKLLRAADPLTGNMLAMRSDMTVQIARIAQSLLADAPRPLRLCYQGTVVKLRADQLHPERQQTQLGAELIGYNGPAAAREILSMAVEALLAAGVNGITIDINLPDLFDQLAGGPMPIEQGKRAEVQHALDMKDAGALVSLGADEYMPLLSMMGAFEPALEKLSTFDKNGVMAKSIADLRGIVAPISSKVQVTLDPTERHGFEYQSWFGFTIFARGHNEAIGRGGAYNIKNASANGGAAHDEPAIGFSLYPDPLFEKNGNMGGDNFLFLPLGHDEIQGKKFRENGWRTVTALSEADDAKKLGCSHIFEGGALKRV